jgi:hypothetical protein
VQFKHTVVKQTSFVALGMFLAISIPSFVQAGGVQVFPLYLFLNSPTRSVTLSVTNPLERSQEAWVEFRYGYPVLGDSGKFTMRYVEPPYSGEPSAVQWLRAYPQRFVLGPKESQVIRILVTPPLGIAPGEYWARVVIASSDQNSPKPANPGGNLSMKLKYINQIDVPFHFRTGNPSTGLSVRKVESSISNGKMKLDVDVTRLGNAAFWGRLTATIRNRDGKILKNDDKPVAIYKDILYPMMIDVSTIPSGTYNLELVFSARRPGVQSQYVLKADPVRYTQEITIP